MPLSWLTCPIYAEGILLPKRDKSKPDVYSDGKVPYGKAWRQKLNVNDSALMIEKEPDIYKAIGVFTGPRSDGLVMFDVDKNLGAIEKKWGKDLKKAPKITSLKKNAAKFLFKVPQELWSEMESVSHTAAGHEGWEVLWGGQGVVAGEYYKEEIGKGTYKLKGDLFDVPVAPEWLLTRMKEQYTKKHQSIEVKYVDNRWSKRTKEERIAIVSGCLSVIKYTGPNSERYWWEIGAMINNELPGIEGLELWREWSKKDPDYEHCWDSGSDPCEARWYATWRNDGAQFNMSHLIKLADEVDPDRKRFKETGLDKLIDEVQAIPLRYAIEVLDGEDLIKKYMDIDNDPKNENPALHNQAVHKLAIEAKRGNAAEIERLIDAHEMFNRTKGQKPLAIDELDDTPFDYLIPGLLPKPWTLLVHADGGTGKTAMCQTIAKHIGQGKAFNVYGALVNVPVGKVLWLNGDQNERILRRQMKLIGCDKNVKVVTEWDMQWYSRFKKMLNKNKYDLVVIDSLDGCNDHNPYEENRREYALPIKKLVRRNGQDFPACSIIIIHHNTKEGKFRGTSAIKNAVDESWNMRKLSANDAAEMGLNANSRLVTVEKSREDREGERMIFTLKADFTYDISPAPERADEVRLDTPNKHTLDILNLMRRETKAWCVKDLVDHDTVGGIHRKRSIVYSLNKLEGQKLIEEVDVPRGKSRGGRPSKFYKAVGKELPRSFSSLPRDIPHNEVYKPNNVDTGTDLNNNEIGINPNFVKTPEEDGGLYKEEVNTKPIVNETPSTGTEEGLYTPGSRYKEDEDDKFWDTNDKVQKMTTMDVIDSIIDARSNNTDIIDI